MADQERCDGTGWLDASYPHRVANSPAAETYEYPCPGCPNCERESTSKKEQEDVTL